MRGQRATSQVRLSCISECVFFDPEHLTKNATRFGGDCHRLPMLVRYSYGSMLASTFTCFLDSRMFLLIHDREPLVMAAMLSRATDRGGTFVVRAGLITTLMVRLYITCMLPPIM